MIQRIQSLYLLLVTVLYSLLFIIPLNQLIAANHVLELNIFGIYELETSGKTLIASLYPILILVIVSILISLISIFLFKKRKIQMRLSMYNAILGIGIEALALFYIYRVAENNDSSFGFAPGLLIPIVSSIFSFLAFKSIDKDEKLVRSIDRIR
jgi:hypothetical protein